MILRGKYNQAEIFTDNVDYACMDQIKNLLNCHAFENEQIRIMPDCHAGTGCVVGYTQTLRTGKVCVGLVGCDIGCGMSYVKVNSLNVEQVSRAIQKYVPSGFDIHKSGELPTKHVNRVIDLMDKINAPLDNVRRARIWNSIGTLGGGNHFIEVDRCEETGDLYLVVHTGSRNLGLQVFKYWHAVAERETKKGDADLSLLIAKLKEEGRHSEIEAEIAKAKENRPHIPKEFSYLEGASAEKYMHDMELCQEFAEDNRRLILTTILSKVGALSKETENGIRSTIHNYIDTENRIIRKGAISAQAGEEVLIPMNMRDGSLLCIGKGNENWNFSAPHGAGRIMSRSQAKKNISMDEYRKSMKGIYSTSISKSTLDESPMAYKPAEEIEALIGDTVEVKFHLKPIFNFKAGSEDCAKDRPHVR